MSLRLLKFSTILFLPIPQIPVVTTPLSASAMHVFQVSGLFLQFNSTSEVCCSVLKVNKILFGIGHGAPMNVHSRKLDRQKYEKSHRGLQIYIQNHLFPGYTVTNIFTERFVINDISI